MVSAAARVTQATVTVLADPRRRFVVVDIISGPSLFYPSQFANVSGRHTHAPTHLVPQRF